MPDGAVSTRLVLLITLLLSVLATAWWYTSRETQPKTTTAPTPESSQDLRSEARTSAERSPALAEAHPSKSTSSRSAQYMDQANPGPAQDSASDQIPAELIDHWAVVSAWTTDGYRSDLITTEFPFMDAAATALLIEPAESGDREAAYQLYLRYTTCASAPGNEAELAQSVDFWTTVIHDTPEMEPTAMRFIDSQTSDFENCATFDEGTDFEALAFQWFTRAGQLDHLIAQIDYPQHARIFQLMDLAIKNPEIIITYRENALQFLQRAVRSGHAAAFLSMANEYHEGVLLDSDPVLAYAWAHAAKLAGHRTNTDSDFYIDKYRELLDIRQEKEGRQKGRLLCKQYCRGDD